jgi:trehalose-6-phosphate synthase
MAPDERGERMRRLREVVQREDVYRWADSFLAAALAAGQGEEPPALRRWN